MSYKKWTNKEISKLIYLFCVRGLNSKNCANYFTNRTNVSVHVKIKKLKLKHTDKQKHNLHVIAKSGKNNPMYGKKSWSNGLTKNSNSSLLNMSLKNRELMIKRRKENPLLFVGDKNGMYGKKSWNSGLTKYNDKRVKKYGQKISIIKKELFKNPKYKEKYKDSLIKATKACRGCKNPTKIEKKISELLTDQNIYFKYQYNKNVFFFDFFLPEYNLVIECQGDYWHANPNKFTKLDKTQISNIKRDERKINFLKENNISAIFIWENTINNNIQKIKECINDKIKNNVDQFIIRI